MSLKPEDRNRLKQDHPEFVREAETLIWKVPQCPDDPYGKMCFEAGERRQAMRAVNKPQARTDK